MVTQKSLKRERFFEKMLSKSKVQRVIARVIKAESKCSKRKSTIKETKSQSNPFPNSEVKTLAATSQAVENVKRLPRIESAGQMILFDDKTSGPKIGQVTRGISANIEYKPPKRKLFHINTNLITEELYKEKINYNDSIKLKNKSEFKDSPIIPQINEIKSNILPKLEVRIGKLPKLLVCNLLPVPVSHRKSMLEKSEMFFDFTQYNAMIMASALKNQERHLITGKERNINEKRMVKM